MKSHGGDGKTVWALIDHPSSDGDIDSAEDLLALWSDEHVPADLPSPELVEVDLDVTVALMLDSRAHTEDLVRELQLIALGAQRHPAPAQVLALAHRLTVATEAFYGPRRQILNQTLSAAQRGRTRTSLRLHLHREDAEAARQWLQSLDEADALTTEGVLLLPPFPPVLTAFRRQYIKTIITALEPAEPETRTAPAQGTRPGSGGPP